MLWLSERNYNYPSCPLSMSGLGHPPTWRRWPRLSCCGQQTHLWNTVGTETNPAERVRVKLVALVSVRCMPVGRSGAIYWSLVACLQWLAFQTPKDVLLHPLYPYRLPVGPCITHANGCAVVCAFWRFHANVCAVYCNPMLGYRRHDPPFLLHSTTYHVQQPSIYTPSATGLLKSSL